MVEAKIINYKKALVEVDAVLSCLDYNEYKKIPANIIDAIENNKDEEYMYDYDEELEYEDWSLMPETKAILYNIFKKYLATEEQRKYLQQKERLENYKIESEKIKKYNSENLFKKEKEVKKVEQEENNELIVKRDSSFKRILEKLKSIFRFIKGL
ncbi:MAG: hypothetical protein ACLVAK_09630 [Clostridia bacterium]